MAIIEQKNSNETHFFLHILKTAGRTMRDVMGENYSPAETVLAIQPGMWRDSDRNDGKLVLVDGRQPVDLDSIIRRARLLDGHIPFDCVAPFRDRLSIFTMLRSPVDRVISEYNHAATSPWHYLYSEINENHIDFERYIGSGFVKTVESLQVRFVAGVHRERPLGSLSVADLNLAKENLASFTAFGLVERFDESLQFIGRRLGWRRDSMTPRVVGKSRSVVRREDLSAACLRRLENSTGTTLNSLNSRGTCLGKDFGLRKQYLNILHLRDFQWSEPVAMRPKNSRKVRVRRQFDHLVSWLTPYFLRGAETAISRLSARASETRKRQWQTCGVRVRLARSAKVAHGRGLTVGNDVEIGERVFIDAEGGVLVGDDAVIERGAVICASEPVAGPGLPRSVGKHRQWGQVVIGRGARIGMNACVRPGVRVGARAIVRPGVVVTEDVPDGAVVEAAAARIVNTRDLGTREASMMNAAEGDRSYGAATVARRRPRGCDAPPAIAFVVTTGRSGSTSIARALDAHPRIEARHEPRMQMIAWSTEYARGAISRATMTERLAELFLQYSVYDSDVVRVESDQKYFNVIDILAKILPQSRFIFLTRAGDAVVSSTFARGWYREELDLPKEEDHWFWNHYLVSGAEAGDVTQQAWAEMTAFEKNCWYWSFVNRTIRRQLSTLAQERWMRVSLERLDAQLTNVLQFLNLPVVAVENPRENMANYARYPADQWSEEQRDSFRRICGPLMRELYPENDLVSGASGEHGAR